MMAKLSIGSKLFERVMGWIWPGEESKLKKTRYMIGNVLIWVSTTRRRIYYAIINAWGNYGYCKTNGGEKENVKLRITEFIFWMVRRYTLGYINWAYITSGLAPWVCKRYGHKIEDLSSAGPESGNMDHGCKRCGEFWKRSLY